MKSLFLFLALAFLVNAKPNPEGKPAAEPGDETTDAVVQMAGGNGPANDAAPRNVAGSCYSGQGYCYPRHRLCSSGRVFLEQFNTCWNKKVYKCCVP